MKEFVVIVLLLIIVFLISFGKHQSDQVKELKKQLKQLQEQQKEEKEQSDKNKKIRDRIWKYINIVHLYAALSAEETAVRSIKDKQTVIIETAEEIIEQLKDL